MLSTKVRSLRSRSEDFAGGGDVFQVGVEGVGEAGDEAAVTLDEGGFAFTVDVIGERLGGCFFGHAWLRGTR